MPKETFSCYDEGRMVRVIDAEGKESKETLVLPFLTVGWNRNVPSIELATREGGDIDESERERGGYFAHLDREGINRLIRTLRKARDQAFGADA